MSQFSPSYFACLTAVVIASITLPMSAMAQQVPEALVQTVPTHRSTNDPPAPAQASAQTPEFRTDRLAEGMPIPNANSETPQAYLTYKTPYEFWLTGMTVAIMVFSILLLCLMAWKSAITVDFTRTFTIIVVVFAALFLISAGYSDKQAAPVYSLLGTIIGYIFGRLANSVENKSDTGEVIGEKGSSLRKESPTPPY